MIDVHSHILYDVDDGAKYLEKSIDMLKQAKELGFTDVILTPHYMEDGYKTSKEEIFEKTEQIRNELIKQEIDIKIHNGEEVFIFPTLSSHIDKDILSMNNSKYILIEFPLLENLDYIDSVIYEVQSAGKVPIIAHPERYYETSKSLAHIKELVSRGVLMQLNTNSLTGHYGSDVYKVAKKLLKENLIHLVGSDAHRVRDYIEYNDSMKELKKLVGDKKFDELTEINPSKVLNDEEVIMPKVKQSCHKFKFGFMTIFMILIALQSFCFGATKEDVIVAINKTYAVGSETYRLPQNIINKGTNYLNKHPMTSEDYDGILRCISNAVKLANEVGTTDITKVSKEDLRRAINIVAEAASIADVDMQKALAESNIPIKINTKEDSSETTTTNVAASTSNSASNASVVSTISGKQNSSTTNAGTNSNENKEAGVNSASNSNVNGSQNSNLNNNSQNANQNSNLQNENYNNNSQNINSNDDSQDNNLQNTGNLNSGENISGENTNSEGTLNVSSGENSGEFDYDFDFEIDYDNLETPVDYNAKWISAMVVIVLVIIIISLLIYLTIKSKWNKVLKLILVILAVIAIITLIVVLTWLAQNQEEIYVMYSIAQSFGK